MFSWREHRGGPFHIPACAVTAATRLSLVHHGDHDSFGCADLDRPSRAARRYLGGREPVGVRSQESHHHLHHPGQCRQRSQRQPCFVPARDANASAIRSPSSSSSAISCIGLCPRSANPESLPKSLEASSLAPLSWATFPDFEMPSSPQLQSLT